MSISGAKSWNKPLAQPGSSPGGDACFSHQ